MKNKILEVQNYFINKITACEFDSHEFKDTNDGWFSFTVKIDSLLFVFGVNPIREIYCFFSGPIEIKVPNSRLKNLIELIESNEEKMKAEKIEKLKAELAELEPKQKFNINPQN